MKKFGALQRAAARATREARHTAAVAAEFSEWGEGPMAEAILAHEAAEKAAKDGGK